MLKIDKAISKADNLMEEGNKEEAKNILEELIQENPNRKSIYSEVASIYMSGNMFSKVKEIFELYEGKFNKKLSGLEFTLENIAKLEKENRNYSLAKVKVFKRMTLWKRGHFTNYHTFSPIQEIQLHDDRILLKIRSKEYHYKWNEIINASIVRRKAYKAMGGQIGFSFIQKLFIFQVSNKNFKFDVSDLYPDFNNNNFLLSELKKHLKIVEMEMSRKTTCEINLRNWTAYILFFVSLIGGLKYLPVVFAHIYLFLEKFFAK
ncbi:MAG: hypothetical protein V1670_00165 [Candidatus Omnitrophota bacterium]